MQVPHHILRDIAAGCIGTVRGPKIQVYRPYGGTYEVESDEVYRLIQEGWIELHTLSTAHSYSYWYEGSDKLKDLYQWDVVRLHKPPTGKH